MAKVYHNDLAYKLMQFALSLYFLILGILEVAGYGQSDLITGINRVLNRGGNPTIDLILGILAIISAALLLFGVFQRGRSVSVFSLIILVYWAVRFVYVKAIIQVQIVQGSLQFLPSLETWLLTMSQDLIILCALWIILRGYGREA